MSSSKLPAFQFYPGDWMKDPYLLASSLAAQGLWMRMICIMHECSQRGYLSLPNGKPISIDQLAKQVGNSPTAVKKLITELENLEIFSRNSEGIIFSRRMVRDEEIRKIHAECGGRGGTYNRNKNQDVNSDLEDSQRAEMGTQTGTQMPTQTGTQTGTQNGPPSSSSSVLLLTTTTTTDSKNSLHENFQEKKESEVSGVVSAFSSESEVSSPVSVDEVSGEEVRVELLEIFGFETLPGDPVAVKLAAIAIREGLKLRNLREWMIDKRREKAKQRYEIRGPGALLTWAETDLGPWHTARAAETLGPAVGPQEQARGGLRVCRPPDDSEASVFASRLYARHPKKRNKILVEHAVASLFLNDRHALFPEIDRIHALWCGSANWQENNGAYAPKLDEWLIDEGWTIEPKPQVQRAKNYDERIDEIVERKERERAAKTGN